MRNRRAVTPRTILSRVVGVALVLLVAAAGLSATPGPAVAATPADPPAVSARPAPKVYPATRIGGEKIKVVGKIPTKFPRKVRLEGKLAGGSWQTIVTKKTGKNGKATLYTTALVVLVRLTMSPANHAGKHYTSYQTGNRAVGLDVQAAQLTLPTSVPAGSPATASISVTPARNGRPVRLQRLVGAVWTDENPISTDASPTKLHTIVVPAGATQYRVVADAFHGAPQVVSATRVVTGTVVTTPPPAALGTTLISASAAGVQGQGTSTGAAVSSDGRYVAYMSEANNLVPDDTQTKDVFLYDRVTHATTMVSRAVAGAGSGTGLFPAVSAHGEYVVFASADPGLVVGDTNNVSDVFLWSRATGQTVLVSHAAGGGFADGPSSYPTISGDGQYVAYETFASTIVPRGDFPNANIVLWNRTTGASTLASDAPGPDFANSFSNRPALSADGGSLTFQSAATNLIGPNSPTSGHYDIVVEPLAGGVPSGLPVLVSHTTSGPLGQADDGSEEPAISDDGRFVAYRSYATSLVAGDTNNQPDIFVWDRTTGANVLVSHTPGGGPGNAASAAPSVSGDGHFVAFDSVASNLVAGDPGFVSDVMVWNRLTGAVGLVTYGVGGAWPDRASFAPSLSYDGSYVGFDSTATNLVPGDDGSIFSDVFLTHRAIS